jgi:hypothetical protein
MDKDIEERLVQMVGELDALISKYDEFLPHQITGVLLSRVTLLMTMDPETGKGLLRYVWEKLDEIEQNNPGSML